MTNNPQILKKGGKKTLLFNRFILIFCCLKKYLPFYIFYWWITLNLSTLQSTHYKANLHSPTNIDSDVTIEVGSEAATPSVVHPYCLYLIALMHQLFSVSLYICQPSSSASPFSSIMFHLLLSLSFSVSLHFTSFCYYFLSSLPYSLMPFMLPIFISISSVPLTFTATQSW